MERTVASRTEPDFKTILESSPARYLIVLPDAPFTIAAVTDAYLRAAGTTRAEVVGRGILEAFPNNPKLRESLERVLRAKAPDQDNAPVLGEDGELRYIIHRVEDASVEREPNLLRLVLDQMPSGCIIADASGRIVASNEQASRIWRRRGPFAETMAEYGKFRGFHADGREYLPEEWPIARALLSGEEVTGERIAILRFDDTPGTIEVSAEPVRSAKGELVAGVVIFTDVTEQQRAEAALRESEERLRAALSNAPIVTYTTDKELRYRWIHGGLHRARRDSLPEDPIGKRDDELPPFEGVRELMALKRRVIDSGMGERREIPMVINGKRETYDITAEPLRNDSGEIIGCAVATLDVTERQLHEEALERSEGLFRQLADSMPQMVWTARPDGYVDYYNERWYEFTGFPRGEGGDPSWQPIVHPGDFQACHDAWYRAVNGGHPLQIECRFRDGKERRWRWHLVRALPARDSDGAIVKWFGTCTDIDHQKRTAEALEASEARVRFTLDGAKLGSWELNLQTGHAMRSSRHDEIFGYETPLADWTYAQFLTHVVSDDRRFVDDQFQKSLTAGEWDFECRIRRPDGALRWIWGYGKTVLDEAGQPLQMLGLVADITPRKEAERALERANEELRRANSDLEQFAFSASHDLQEPLRNVSIYSQLLNQRYSASLDPEAQEYLGYLTEGSQRMGDLISDLLAYTRISGAPDGPHAVSNAEAVLEKVLASFVRAAVTHDRLPVVAVQEAHLQQLFLNLVGNALKYRKDDAPARIHVSAARDDGYWKLSVRDNGIGIAPQYHEKIFGIFKRLHGRGRYSGTGIGLAICLKIVERYGGRIWVESELGEGATFHFTLPAEGGK